MGRFPPHQHDDKAYLPGVFMAEIVSHVGARKVDEHPKADVYCPHPIRPLLATREALNGTD